MKKYFKHKTQDIHYVCYENGTLSIFSWDIAWYTSILDDLVKSGILIECTREECEAAYKQTIQFLNDKIK